MPSPSQSYGFGSPCAGDHTAGSGLDRCLDDHIRLLLGLALLAPRAGGMSGLGRRAGAVRIQAPTGPNHSELPEICTV